MCRSANAASNAFGAERSGEQWRAEIAPAAPLVVALVVAVLVGTISEFELPMSAVPQALPPLCPSSALHASEASQGDEESSIPIAVAMSPLRPTSSATMDCSSSSTSALVGGALRAASAASRALSAVSKSDAPSPSDAFASAPLIVLYDGEEVTSRAAASVRTVPFTE